MKTLIFAGWLMCMSTPVHAVDVMAYGDSTTFNGYPAALQAARPDLLVYNRGLSGDVSWNIVRFDAALAERQWEHVLIMIGVNDVLSMPTYDPHQTFLNIWTMTQHAKNAGAEVWLLTPTPVAPPWPFANQQVHTLAIANELAHRDLDNTHPHVHFVYLRDQFTILDWPSLTTDGIHPNAAGNAIIAGFLGDILP